MNQFKQLANQRELPIDEKQRESDFRIQHRWRPKESRLCIVDNLQRFFRNLLFRLDFFEEVLFHKRVRFLFAVNTRTKEMDDLCITEHRVNNLDAI